MASKRTKNRLYWLAVKSVALSYRMTNGRPVETPPVRAYKEAMSGYSDGWFGGYVDELEGLFGKHTRKDLSNQDLWIARDIVDHIGYLYVNGGAK